MTFLIVLAFTQSYHFSLFVADILLLSPFLGEGLGVREINHLCHYFRKMVSGIDLRDCFTLVKPKVYGVVLKVDTKLFCGLGWINTTAKMYA